jgi:NAD+ kinase
MAKLLPIPKHIAVAAHVNVPGSLDQAEKIAALLTAHGVATVAWGALQDAALIKRIEAGEFDLLIAIGGDGTMLRAGSLGAPLGLPILGINMGHFGFLAEIQLGQCETLLPRLLEGRYWLEERMLLRAKHIRNGETLGSWHVVNEVVVCRGQIVKPIQIEALVNGYLLTTYIADGLLASTPTGSTAYALAAGGPILPPNLRNILIIPVAPHLSVDRAIILPEGDAITMTVHTTHEAVMSVDGRTPVPLLDGDSVNVMSNESTLHFVRFQDQGYFYRNITAYMNQNPRTGNNR